MAQRLDEGPLPGDRDVEQRGVQGPRPRDRSGPQTVERLPRVAEALCVGGAHQRPLRVEPVQLDLDEAGDVDAVDAHVEELTADLDVRQLDAAHHHVVQADPAEGRAAEVAGPETAVAQVDPFEP